MKNAFSVIISSLLLASMMPAQKLTQSVLPVHLQVIFMPPPVRTDSGSTFAYELHIANYRDLDLSISRLQVFATNDPKHPLAEFSDKVLQASIYRPGRPADLSNPEMLHGGDFAVVFLWFALNPSQSVPSMLAHRVIFQRLMADGTQKDYAVEGASIGVPPEQPITIHPPCSLGRWLMTRGPSQFGGHRMYLQAVDGKPTGNQRFASDWLLLGSDGRLATHVSTTNNQWYGYGTSVFAVADGIVESIGDGIPENVPLSSEQAVPNRRETIGGNYVVLRIRNDVFAYYAHLQPKSIRVVVGDTVRSGQILGRVGNSGNSEAPHLHFHMMNGADPAAGEGIPFVFDSYVQFAALDAAACELMVQDNAPWTQRKTDLPRLHEREMPVGDAIIEFR